jgi:hypothetical protein
MGLLAVLPLLAVGAAGNPCEEHLKEVESRLTTARTTAHGAVYNAPELAAFEPPVVAGAAPLEFKGAVVLPHHAEGAHAGIVRGRIPRAGTP